ncbi:Hypothetical predicted protein [Xyrichtys novacula]|uniref:Uncharacterized protein n=1 Tax=Xyrichtys novacula TaxID=13765 RepID=A0AAV1EX77_XYRNO|nr:Hypothetical predicted protein [Xyrichtys novacula]
MLSKKSRSGPHLLFAVLQRPNLKMGEIRPISSNMSDSGKENFLLTGRNLGKHQTHVRQPPSHCWVGEEYREIGVERERERERSGERAGGEKENKGEGRRERTSKGEGEREIRGRG